MTTTDLIVKFRNVSAQCRYKVNTQRLDATWTAQAKTEARELSERLDLAADWLTYTASKSTLEDLFPNDRARRPNLKVGGPK